MHTGTIPEYKGIAAEYRKRWMDAETIMHHYQFKAIVSLAYGELIERVAELETLLEKADVMYDEKVYELQQLKGAE
tara:strand:+ start:2622 stop:2849 length:228 start_codon:yes stop_codon:yes gene_type:complete